jgi:segregation and condensation protein A
MARLSPSFDIFKQSARMYKIKLPVFEGPFDLLLYLIKKNEIDIYDIPIARITREYLEYINLMQMLDLEIAGEFIEMVATLILIKTRMLLPNLVEDGSEEIEDPRLQLTLQLLEYRRFKESAEHLQKLEENRRQYFPRRSKEKRRIIGKAGEEDDFEIDATLYDLLTAFKKALDNMPKITVHQVKTIRVTIEDQVNYIIDRLEGKNHILFFDVVKGLTEKIQVVVTFMAILDLMKINLITAKQVEPFEDIRLVPLGELSMSHYLSLREALEIDPAENN